MTEYTVTYRLTPEQEAALRELASEGGRTIAEEFALMMSAGSRWDIDQKLETWTRLIENGRKERANACSYQD